jgi:hypothetical protein
MSHARRRYKYQGAHETPAPPPLWRYAGLPRYRAYIPGRRGFEGAERAAHNRVVARQRRVQLMKRRSDPSWHSRWAEGTIGPYGPYEHPYTAREEIIEAPNIPMEPWWQQPDHVHAQGTPAVGDVIPLSEASKPRPYVPREQPVTPQFTPHNTPGLFDDPGLGTGWQSD